MPDLTVTNALTLGLPSTSDWWLRADPVIFQTDLSQVYLLGNSDLQLSDDEVHAFINELNQFLAPDNLQLFALQKNMWYLQSHKNPEITTFPLSVVIGKNIYDYLPQGKNSAYWRTLLTEIQMLLHQSPVNLKRKQQGKPVISGIWLWNEDKLPESFWKKVFSNNVLMQSLKKLMRQLAK